MIGLKKNKIMITQISIENFKCFKEKTTFNLSNLNVFAGMNGRGKSTVFQSLLLLAQSLKKRGNIETLCTNGEHIKLYHFDSLVNSYCDNKDNVIKFDIDTDILPDYHNIHLGYEKLNDWNGKLCELKINGKNYFTQITSIGPVEDTTFSERFLQSTYPPMDKVFSSFYYISASRLGPTLYEEKCEEEPFNPLGVLGEKKLAILQSHTSLNSVRFDAESTESNLLPEVNKWLNYIMGSSELKIEESYNTLQLKIKNNRKMGKYASSINMGYGYSYILSIIIIALIAEKGSTLFIENPEAHLHPLAQARLMELLAKVAMNDIQVNIETHSDHILNSVRLYCLKEEMTIKNNNVSIYFFDEEFNVFALEMDANGQIPKWPKGFFDLQEQQLMEILKLGLLK